MGRAAVVNVAQLVSYSQFKQMILENSKFFCGLTLPHKGSEI